MAFAIREKSQISHITELVGRFTASSTAVNKDSENTVVNEILDQFNSLNFDNPSSSSDSNFTKHIERFIEHCCVHVSADSGQLGIRCCIVINNLIIKSEAELSDHVIGKLLLFLHNYMNSYDPWAHADILKTLSALLYCRGGRLSVQQLDGLVTVETGLLYKVIFDPNTDSHTRKEALRCVENLCRRCFPYIDDYYASLSLNIFLSVLKTKFPKTDDFLQCKLLMVALKGIHQVISNTKTAHGSLLGEILAALKAYNFFGRDDPSVQIPSCLHPTYIGEEVPQSVVNPAPPRRPQKKTLKKKGRPRRQRREELDSDGEDGGAGYMRGMGSELWNRLSGSESDYSDTEAGGPVNKLQGCQARVRQCSLATLFTVVKGSMKRLIFGYWTSFLPTSPDERAGTLAALLDSEWSNRVKVAALAAIAAFLDRSKSTLVVATERESSSTTPFTPFSVLLGNMIKELHTSLMNLLRVESSSYTLTSVIKCLAMLVANSPYQKLKPGLLSKTVKLIRPYLSHREVNVKVAALTCMGSAVTVHAPLLEVVHILLPPARQEDHADHNLVVGGGDNSQGSTGASQPSTPPVLSSTPGKSAAALAGHSGKDSNLWLVKTCGRCIHSSSPGIVIPLPLRVEALQVLSSLALGYLTVLRSSLGHLTNILVQSLTDSDSSVQLHAAKTSDSVAVAFSRHFTKADDSEDETLTTEEALTFWNTLLSGPLVTALQKETNTQLRAKCCDCLANIGAKVFESVQTNKQIICITMLLGMSADPEPLVRESAARALGVYVLFPCQKTDVSFVADVANAVITSLEDEALPVKIQSAWALANVTEALVLNMGCEDFESFANMFSDVLLLRLYDAATHATQQEDKIRYNGVRALGNLLRYTQLSTLQKRSMSHVIDNSVRTLVQNLGQGAMKVRWNACYALGGLLQNDHVTLPSASWLGQVYTALCLAMKNSKNFKVRINASQALQTARQRVKYGSAELFTCTWKYVIEAMAEADKTEDFTNYKYMSSLSHQLRRTVLHLTSLTQSDDLLCLGAVLFSKEDTIKQFLNDSAEPLDRETCITHLRLLESEGVGAERSLVLSTLLSIVTPPVNDEEEPAKTTFRPSYD